MAHDESTNDSTADRRHTCDWPYKKGEVFALIEQRKSDHLELKGWVGDLDRKVDDVLRKTGFYAAVGSAIPVVLSIIIAVVVYLVTRK